MPRRERKTAGATRKAKARPGPLGPRVEAIESRVDDLGGRVDHLEVVTGVRPPPPPPPEPEAKPRCPGCRLQIDEPREDRCVWCGFVFSAA
jgi:hypothetical protein